MSPTRRSVLKGIASAAALAATGAPEAFAGPLPKKTPPPDAVGLLYDATRCIGCRACVLKCKEANGMPPASGTARGAMYGAPDELNSKTKNIINLYKGEDGRTSFMKA